MYVKMDKSVLKLLWMLFGIQILWLVAVTSANVTTRPASHLNCTVSNVYKRDHSLASPVKGSASGKIEGWEWEYKGHTEIVEADNLVRLFPTGSLWNSKPVKVENWEVELQFKVHRQVTTEKSPDLVFWYTKDRSGHRDTVDTSGELRIVVKTHEELDESTGSTASPNSDKDKAKKHSTIVISVNNNTRSYDDVKDNWGSGRGCWEKLKDPSTPIWFRVRYERNHLTVSTLNSTGDSKKWEDCVHERENTDLPVSTDTDHDPRYFFGLSVSKVVANSSSSVDLHEIKTYELDLQQSTAPACEDLHFHADDDHDDAHHRPVLLEKRVRHEDGSRPQFKFPFMVLAVPLVGLIIVAAFCIVGLKGKSMEKLPSRYVHRRASHSQNPPVY